MKIYHGVVCRSASRLEVDHQGDGAITADRLTGVVRHHHIRDHRAGVLLGRITQDMLQSAEPERDGVQWRKPDTVRRRLERYPASDQL